MPGLISSALDFAFGAGPLKKAAKIGDTAPTGTRPAATPAQPKPTATRPVTTPANVDVAGDASKMAAQKLGTPAAAPADPLKKKRKLPAAGRVGQQVVDQFMQNNQ